MKLTSSTRFLLDNLILSQAITNTLPYYMIRSFIAMFKKKKRPPLDPNLSQINPTPSGK
jgi:hypothetical protein